MTAIVTALVLAAFGFISVSTAGDVWACDSNRIATSVFEVAEEGGYPTTDAALLAAARLLANDGVADKRELEQAAADSLDGSGRLLLKGEIVAEVSRVKLGDGTWTAGSIQFCSPPPVGGGDPVPTPTDSPEGSS
ncbi:MAG: hypothetical protein WEE66_09185 [Actinomycetota bacterium]